MSLRKKGKYYYGESQRDIEGELLRYSNLNEYPTTHYKKAFCHCGSKLFNLMIDDNEGAAVRNCVSCQQKHPIGDSSEYLDDAELEECECPCGSSAFEITVGVSLYQDSKDVKWFYIGCRCEDCGLTACYGDWKNEYTNFQDLLSRV